MALLVGIDVQGDELIVAYRRNGDFLPPAQVVVNAAEVLDHTHRVRQDSKEQVVAAIDAPRRYLSAPRQWQLNNAGVWIAANIPGGRHCEIIVRRLGLANPQWTPPIAQPIPWITLGQEVFVAFEAAGFTAIECFPTASYTRLGQMGDLLLNVPSGMFSHSRLAHDILDACVAAFTADLFLAGNATELGGGDGYGTIVVPGVLQLTLPAFPSDP
jgi:predicted nuclease with RNAse H fold